MDFSIVILENQVHSAKSILKQRNLLLAKKKKQKTHQPTKQTKLKQTNKKHLQNI